ncbi:response regulator [Actinacidiphila oryziradicis]|jgi:DNA-binding NarL/FixJ family response regulator|uniref:Response regulator transcription factor n=1 Tax=Actinacidiphila oryziradicis TaxID=2571141 RepID=A0A4U0ST29_9ACTN|nr:response regulator transcription factor [Actinacidiphila oryziradicis]TKA12563.1 response regulator transcription factor [Actinacidiphila oryziradicis]
MTTATPPQPSGSAPKIRVLIADDQPLMRQGFAMILSAQGDIEVVGEAGTGYAAIEKAQALSPDVVLMDIQMPGLDGIAATRELRGTRILILTTFGRQDYVAEALCAGASGFLLKDVTPDQLVHAVRVIAAGDALLDPAVTRSLIQTALPALAVPLTPPRFDILSNRESQVLRMIAQGLSNAEIATALVLSEATVKTHVSRVLAKLALRDRVQAVVLAHQHGLV